MSRATLVATLRSSRVDKVSNSVEWRASDWLEVRTDLISEADPVALRSTFHGKMLCSLRSRRAGGRNELSEAARRTYLRRAARFYDFVDLEAEQDLLPDLLRFIRPSRRVISWYGSAHDARTLETWSEIVSRNSARLYRFELACSTVEEGLIALQFLSGINRKDVIAYATGPFGVWTRILAPTIGAPIAFGNFTDDYDNAAGNPTISELMEDYGFPDLQPASEIYAIAGEPILGSLSPRLHNAAYRASRADRVFLSFPTSSLNRLWSRLISSGDLEKLGMTIRGLTVAAPNKEAALNFSRRIASLCSQCRATNVLVRQNGDWAAGTTEPEGIFHQRQVRCLNLSGARVAVVGCGGSGRVTAAVLAQRGADVTLVNRNADRGRWSARLLGLRFVPLKEFSVRGYSMVINATPVGRQGDELPISLKSLNPGSLIIDLVYNRTGPTPLIASAHALGHRVIEGSKVLLAQTIRQYLLMTGEQMPEQLARELLGITDETTGVPKSAPLLEITPKMEAQRC
jgi:3-dehydroquinate dehydratase / shikimate dehydrogenase